MQHAWCPQKKLVSECCMSPKILTKNGWVGQKFPLDMTWECMISFFGTPFRPMIQNHVTVLAPTISIFLVNIWAYPPIAKMIVVLTGTAPSLSWPLLFAERFKAEKNNFEPSHVTKFPECEGYHHHSRIDKREIKNVCSGLLVRIEKWSPIALICVPRMIYKSFYGNLGKGS